MSGKHNPRHPTATQPRSCQRCVCHLCLMMAHSLFLVGFFFLVVFLFFLFSLLV